MSNRAFTVITSRMCPCENCAGDLIDEATVEEFPRLSEALWEVEQSSTSANPVESFDFSASTYPFDADPHTWWSLFGTSWEGETPCGEQIAVEVSLFLPDRVTASSRMRIHRLLCRYYGRAC